MHFTHSKKKRIATYHCLLTNSCQRLKRLRLEEWAEPHQPISDREISMASELRIQEREKITLNTPNMANVTEHPFRVKRRKLDEGSQGIQDVTFTSSAQLRGALIFQQNPQLANKGESRNSNRLASIQTDQKHRNYPIQAVSAVNWPGKRE